MKHPRTFFRSAALVLGICLWAAALSPRSASADAYYGFVQITCAPGINYFSIRRFQLLNLPHDILDRDRKSARPALTTPHGIYNTIQLKNAPAECDLFAAASAPDQPKRRIRLRVAGFYDDRGGTATSERQIVDNVDVLADGKSLGRLLLNPYGFLAGDTDMIEVFVDGLGAFARKCSHHEALKAQQKKGCTTERF
jgi:hypothetical protein